MTTDLFDLTLNEEQRITRENMLRFVRESLTPAARQADDQAAMNSDLISAIHDFGLALMPVPEALGGVGLPRSPLSNALACEDLGTGDMSHALAALQPMAAVNALMDFGSEEQQEQWLPGLASEQWQGAAVALVEPRATFEPTELHTRAERDGESFTLTGSKGLVPAGESCQWFLVVAATADGPGAFIVPADAQGLTVSAEPAMGLRSAGLCSLVLDQVKVSADQRLPHFDLERLLGLSWIGLCALSVGCCQSVLDYAIPYVKERKAFGEPIAWRQSVAFMVSDMAIELEGMRLMMLRAASRAEQGLPFYKEAYLAHLQCMEKAMAIGTNGIQLFGGAGFVRDYPLEMWYRNLRSIAVLHGSLMV
ncbi:acyl-CoA dehydrogenase family protein [Alcanivorax sp. DP30]|uniref:acyl-CoA dehydrogenase family protein n=1 Tax=Alcanivorax sp. DP30 TaxID=2606217 RepID=UPI001371629B|nr:acyl-CoA dehydrogenase family protein [Alcanivorax sp. DP30]MZR61687.1 oxidoreductase [Alcanivorax sp. DP30]